MSEFSRHQIARSERLQAICTGVGFTLWQLQELEGVAATYFVLVRQAIPGMGEGPGLELLETALSKTFGATLAKLAKAGVLSEEMASRLEKVLVDRNWLVHGSRASSSGAVESDELCESLCNRLHEIADEARMLAKEFLVQTEKFALARGISEVRVKELMRRPPVA